MITDIEDFFVKGCGRCDRFDTSDCAVMLWSDGLGKLREICLSAGLEETVKWGQPCYMHAGRNIAIMGAYQNKFVFGFFNAALMKDPDGVLERPGPNTQHANTISFTDIRQVAAMKDTIRAYLNEAKAYAEAGKTPPKNTKALDLPDELAEALDADVELAEAFYSLTPGRQRSYVIHLNGAKKSETRIKRIEKFRDKIIAGKGATEY
ncbi:YdeI/OmpD-associated family protein [Paracoccus fistulariae]|uniref:YdeI/OmpD-associated family protein n=1 Tax=Paracoccus fistulariae TaxID=658446 RepID=A0ABY7SNW6_9RHOB|nr:YdeI/OmpD-associated family protein [Paracoccus fistulariae]MDB6182460.1 YdeI/OmpD-associated family protein [Paracoccus fistulariae]WCR08569.1 YdeI/OmpD-associated family protein [Paracoccus fistulariae]